MPVVTPTIATTGGAGVCINLVEQSNMSSQCLTKQWNLYHKYGICPSILLNRYSVQEGYMGTWYIGLLC